MKTAAQTGMKEEEKSVVCMFFLFLYMNVLLHISSPHFEKHCKDSLKTPGQCEKPSRFLKGP